MGLHYPTLTGKKIVFIKGHLVEPEGSRHGLWPLASPSTEPVLLFLFYVDDMSPFFLRSLNMRGGGVHYLHNTHLYIFSDIGKRYHL
jgi:hypothetical protein